MVTIVPFRALRYGAGADISAVTAPPYDVISESQRESFADLSPKNIVHLTLPKGLGTDSPYANSARLLDAWKSEGVLIEDTKDSYFLYRRDFHLGGDERTSCGILAGLQLEPFGTDVLPHEKTTAGPKADRLALMRTTSANLEPLWFFTTETLGIVASLMKEMSAQEPMFEVIDSSMVRHRVWRIPGLRQDEVSAAFKQVSLIVADGHHRYETCLAYQKEKLAVGRGPGAWDQTLALIDEPGEYGPAILPIHRVARGLSIDALNQAVRLEHFHGSVEELAREIRRRGQGNIGAAQGAARAIFKNQAGGLDTAFLEEISERLGIEFSYQHSLEEIIREDSSGSLVFLLSPVEVRQVSQAASGGDRMPSKTTLFWPKPLSGLVMRSLGKSKEVKVG